MVQDHVEQQSMGAFTKYTALDHGGLEVVEQNDAPEVVDHTQDYNWKGNLNRKSSLLVPEVLNAAPPYTDHKTRYSYYGADGANAPEHGQSAQQTYISAHGKVTHIGEQEVESGSASEDGGRNGEKRYCCGLRRRGMIILIACIVLLVVIVGAVVGGVLGTILGQKTSSSTENLPLETFSNTGLASTISASDPNHLLTYFQDPLGRILENSYIASTWTLSDRSLINSSVVTTSAVSGSPLAAISYPYEGKIYRQVFFVTSTGVIMSAHSSDTLPGTKISTNWSIGSAASLDAIAASSIGLTACWSQELFNGIRVYYPSQYKYIQELKYDFGGSSWTNGETWDQADIGSGMACAVKESDSQPFLNLYMRLGKSGVVKQVWNDDPDGRDVWNDHTGPHSWTNHTMAGGSDIAVSSDSSQTEYIYYQLDGGLVTRGVLNPTQSVYETFENMPLGAGVGTKLAASFVDGGSLLMYQNQSSDSTIWTDNVSRYGATIMKSVVP